MSRIRCLLLLHDFECGSTPVSPSTIAAETDWTSEQTLAALEALAEQSIVELDQSNRATLTPTGRETAAQLSQTHATLAALFDDVFDVGNPDAAAASIAGVVSPIVTGRLGTTLAIDSAVSTGESVASCSGPSVDSQ